MNKIFDICENKYPPDNPVVFHRRADISPLLLAAPLKGEMRTTACFCPQLPVNGSSSKSIVNWTTASSSFS